MSIDQIAIPILGALAAWCSQQRHHALGVGVQPRGHAVLVLGQSEGRVVGDLRAVGCLRLGVLRGLWVHWLRPNR